MWNKIKMFFSYLLDLCENKAVKKPKPIPKIPVEKKPKPIQQELEFPEKPTQKEVRKRTLYYYFYLWATMIIKEKYRFAIDKAVKKIKLNKTHYLLAEELTGVNWKIIGVIHNLECGCRMDRQLLNGQKWNRKTTLVPTGYGPWKNFQESCVDAFKRHPFTPNMTMPELLKKLERFNGLGYIKRGINSPYLWSFSNQYTSGKYYERKILFKWVSLYKKSIVSKQCGAAILLKELGFE